MIRQQFQINTETSSLQVNQAIQTKTESKTGGYLSCLAKNFSTMQIAHVGNEIQAELKQHVILSG
jgi:hypothetical protein